MKIIFLDIDGVLNSMDYYEKVNIMEEPLNPESLHCLARIVKETDAVIVLTSSWRGGWDPEPSKCDIEGQKINEAFSREGIRVYDKTESLDFIDGTARSREIKKWIKDCPKTIESYVIIDDADFGWKSFKLHKHWVQTDFLKGGLQPEHVKPCIDILNKKGFFFKKFAFMMILMCSFCLLGGCQLGKESNSTANQSENTTETKVNNVQSVFTWNPYVESGFYQDIYGKEFMENVHGLITAMIDHEKVYAYDNNDDWYDIVTIARYLFPPMDEITGECGGQEGEITLEYTKSKEETDQFLDDFKKKVEEWINGNVTLEGPDTLKALQLYHYMSLNVSYDYASNEIMNEENGGDFDVSACHAIMEREGICQSFAGAYSYLLLQLGIDACCTGGLSEDDTAHEWTLLKLNDQWYYSDVTFENGQGGNGLLYFGMTAEKRSAEGNYPIDLFNVGECNQLMGNDFPVDCSDLSELWNVENVSDIVYQNNVITVTGKDSAGETVRMELIYGNK